MHLHGICQQLNIYMHTTDLVSSSGHLHIHVSLSEYNTCYIFVNDIYSNRLKMKWFNNYQSALDWIDSL